MKLSVRVKSISLILAALLLWHYAGVRLYAQTRATQSRQPAQAAQLAPRLTGLEATRFDSLLSEIREVVRHGKAQIKAAPEKGFADLQKLSELKERLVAENEKVENYFSQLEGALEEKKLPAEVLNRQTAFVREYDAKYEALMAHLEGIESAHRTATGFFGKLTGQSQNVNWDEALDPTLSFLEAHTPRARRSAFDPHNLPHRSLKADRPIPPKLTRAEWDRALSTDPADSKQAAKNSTQESSASKSGHLGSPLRTLSTAPPTDADLAETIEVKFTPEIRQLADSLDRNPVRIYNWVRNNIEFAPIWGSIQGAQLCLETRSCNAFDTASLLISLLRFSGVPARYQMGTIEVPVEKFKNWAGGFTNTEAAASLFASGGTPSVVRRVNQSGQVVTVRLEHVWVKAFVDYAPSGGAVNRRGNTWVEMDAGFKQYSFTDGLDFETVAPSNFQSFAIELARTATVDSTTGAVTGFNSAAMTSFVQQVADHRINYVRTNLSNATVREVFGGKAIVSSALTLLPATVPYRVLARAGELAQIPDGLRHRVTVGLASNPQTPDDADLLNYTASLPELAGQNILLLYRPASPADEQLLSLLQSQSSFPSSVSFVPQLYVGSQLVAAGSPVRAGRALAVQSTFSAPTITTPTVFNAMTAGEVTAIGLDLQGSSPSQFQALRQRAEDIRDRLQQGTFQNLTNRDYAEAVLSSNIIGWFASVDANNRLTSQNAGVVTLRYPSAGLFFLRQSVSSLFGVPSSVAPDGMAMDIDRDIVVSLARDGNAEKVASVSLSQGVFGSTNEAEVPLRLLSTQENPASGVATIQALQAANDQGIPIYRINSSNAASIIPLLQIDPGDLADIQDAINAGLEVTVSRTPVNFNGSSVLGTVLSDPVSGSASFLISGGANGAIILIASFVLIVALAVLFLVGAFFLPLLAPLLLIIFVGLAVGALILAIIFAIDGGEAFAEGGILALTPCQLLIVIAALLSLLLTLIATSLGAAIAAAIAAVLGIEVTAAITLAGAGIVQIIRALVGTTGIGAAICNARR